MAADDKDKRRPPPRPQPRPGRAPRIPVVPRKVINPRGHKKK